MSLLLYINCGTPQSTDQSTFSRPYIEPPENDWGRINEGKTWTILEYFIHSLGKKSIKTPIEPPIETPSIEYSGRIEDDLITPTEEDPSDLQTRIDSPSGNEIMPNAQYKAMDRQDIQIIEQEKEDKAARITGKKESFDIPSKKGGFRINPSDDGLRRTGTDTVVVDPPKEKKSWFYKIFDAVFKAASKSDDNSDDEDSSRGSDRTHNKGKKGILSGFDKIVYGDEDESEESILSGFDRIVYGEKDKPKEKIEPEEGILSGFDKALDSLNFKFWEW